MIRNSFAELCRPGIVALHRAKISIWRNERGVRCGTRVVSRFHPALQRRPFTCRLAGGLGCVGADAVVRPASPERSEGERAGRPLVQPTVTLPEAASLRALRATPDEASGAT